MSAEAPPSPIGYVGLGNMGGALVAALARGRETLVFDLAPEAVAAAVRAGAVACPDLAGMARRCPVIFLCLPGIAQVADLLGPDAELGAALPAGAIVVDQSTSHPIEFVALARRLAERGVSLIDAPVSGGPGGVEDGSLMVMIGGAPEPVQVAAEILRAVTERVTRTGPAGSAMATKVANNYIAASQAAISLQALAMAIRFGCDPERTVAAFAQASGSNYYVTRFLASHVLTGELDSAAEIEVMRKDVGLARELAAGLGIPLVGEEALAALIEGCVAEYGRDASYNAIALAVSDMAGVALGRAVGRQVAPPASR